MSDSVSDLLKTLELACSMSSRRIDAQELVDAIKATCSDLVPDPTLQLRVETLEIKLRCMEYEMQQQRKVAEKRRKPLVSIIIVLISIMVVFLLTRKVSPEYYCQHHQTMLALVP